MSRKTIYFVRHGQTEFNKQHIVQGGGIDSELNDTGIQQAQLFFEKYQDIPFEVILTSKLKRTHQTVNPWKNKLIPQEQFPQINDDCL